MRHGETRVLREVTGHSPSRHLTAHMGRQGVDVRLATSEPCHGHQKSLSTEVSEGRASGGMGFQAGCASERLELQTSDEKDREHGGVGGDRKHNP